MAALFLLFVAHLMAFHPRLHRPFTFRKENAKNSISHLIFMMIAVVVWNVRLSTNHHHHICVYLCAHFSPLKILYSGRLVSDDVLYNPSAMVRHTVLLFSLSLSFHFHLNPSKRKKKKERNYTWNDKKIPGPTGCCHFLTPSKTKKKQMKENLQNKKISLCAFMMSRWCRFQWPPRFLYCCCCCVMDERVDGKWEEAPDSSSFFSYCSFSLESNDGAPADMFLLLYDAQLVLFSWQQLISKEKRRNNSAGFPSSLQQ